MSKSHDRTRGAAGDQSKRTRSHSRTTRSGSGFYPVDPTTGTKKPTILIPIWVSSLVVPIIIEVGSLRLSLYRILLIILFVPGLLSWFFGALGRARASDALLLVFCAWATVSLVVNHGIDGAIEPSGMLLIETFGSYILARKTINDARSFRAFVYSLFVVICALIPFGVYETITGQNIYLDVIGKVVRTVSDVPKDPRWGMDRVQGPFEHPILFGVFCSAGFGLAFYCLGHGLSLFRRLVRSVPASLGVFLSLSSGPLSALTVQIMLTGWDLALRKVMARWTLLIVLSVVTYVVVDALSNRTPFEVLITYFSFDPHTAYNRILIWEYGSAESLRHPIFGIGFNEWTRAWFMSTSMDMFWLVNAVQFGLPAALSFTFAVVFILVRLGKLRTTDQRVLSYRNGLSITIVGLSAVGWTVHFWNETYVLFVYLLGSGVWMLNYADKELTSIATSNKAMRKPSGDHVAPPPARISSEARVVSGVARANEELEDYSRKVDSHDTRDKRWGKSFSEYDS